MNIRQNDKINSRSHIFLANVCADSLEENPRLLNWNRGFFIPQFFLPEMSNTRTQNKTAIARISPHLSGRQFTGSKRRDILLN